MMLDTRTVSEIKASNGVYRASDVARHYNVHRSTVVRIWGGKAHREVEPAGDFPDIKARPKTQDLAEDLNIYIERGMSIVEAAAALNISRATAYILKGYII